MLRPFILSVLTMSALREGNRCENDKECVLRHVTILLTYLTCKARGAKGSGPCQPGDKVPGTI